MFVLIFVLAFASVNDRFRCDDRFRFCLRSFFVVVSIDRDSGEYGSCSLVESSLV